MNSQEFYSTWLSIYSDNSKKKKEEPRNYELDREGLISQMGGFSVSELVHFLKVSHQYYLSKKLPEIEQSMLHITGRFSETHSILTSLAYFFNSYKNKLVKHITNEDDILFPYIEDLVKVSKGEIKGVSAEEILSSNTINDFEENHDEVEEELSEVNNVLKAYSEKTTVPLPFRVFLNQISIFEMELKKHAIIEDEVLIPKVQELQAKLNS